VACQLAAVAAARPVRGGECEPRHRVPFRDARHGVHPRRRGDDAVRGRGSAHGAARRPPRDGQRDGCGAAGQRERVAVVAARQTPEYLLRRRWREDQFRLRVPGVRGWADSPGARRTAAHRSREHSLGCRRRVAGELDSARRRVRVGIGSRQRRHSRAARRGAVHRGAAAVLAIRQSVAVLRRCIARRRIHGRSTSLPRRPPSPARR
jgi:hypothetical protein